MPMPPPDWQLPPGVSRGLWHYLHDDAIAQGYDASVAGASLVAVDQSFVLEYCQPPGWLIDLGCGTGRLLVPMVQRGYRVLGVDLSAPMLRVAGSKAAHAGVRVERIQANLVDLGCFEDARFDFATCLFSTLGMVGGAGARCRVVEHVYRLLRPGGVFVLHVHNYWFNVWHGQGRRWLLRDLPLRSLGREGAGDCTMPPHGNMPPLTLHLFTAREARQLLLRAGFALRQVRPVSLREDGKLSWPLWFGWLRAYGYLVAAVKR